jgi:plasmid stabilization system protein ParE
MSYELVIVEPAEFDVETIYRYISQRSPRGAGSWYRACEECLARIVDQPFSCSIAPENPKFPFELRQAIFKTRYGDPYRCVFTVVDNGVRVLRVRGRGQPPLETIDIVEL